MDRQLKTQSMVFNFNSASNNTEFIFRYLFIFSWAARRRVELDEYQNRNTVEKNVIVQLDMEVESLKAGEIVKYIIVDYYSEKKNNNRSIPVELIDETNIITYDVLEYVELLTQTCNSVTECFGHMFSVNACR
jgi:hypothetical protein